jgi:hypothetical protein
MKRIVALIAGAATIAVAAAALAEKKVEAGALCKEPAKLTLAPGVKVISHLAGPNWSVGKVKSVKGKTIEVEDAGGGLGSMGSSDIVPYPDSLYHDRIAPCFKAGDKVLARTKGNIWREATVTDANQGKVTFTFLDNKTGTAGPLDLVRKPK